MEWGRQTDITTKTRWNKIEKFNLHEKKVNIKNYKRLPACLVIPSTIPRSPLLCSTYMSSPSLPCKTRDIISQTYQLRLTTHQGIYITNNYISDITYFLPVIFFHSFGIFWWYSLQKDLGNKSKQAPQKKKASQTISKTILLLLTKSEKPQITQQAMHSMLKSIKDNVLQKFEQEFHKKDPQQKIIHYLLIVT